MEGSIAFRILEGLALAIFAGGVGARVRFWLSAGGGGNPTGGGVAALIRQGARRVPPLRALRGLLLDGLLQRRLLRQSRYRWLTHQFIFWGFVELFFIGSLGDMLGMAKDDAWFAFMNDLGGVVLLIGVGAALCRYYIARREPLLRPTVEEGIVLAWLLVLALSGFLVEAVRWLEAGPGTETAYAFGGFAAQRALEPLDLDWQAAERLSWWVHASLGLALVAYLPFGKLRHLLASPVSIVVNAEAEVQPSGASLAPAGTSALQRLELDACAACGECTRWCEAFAAAGPVVSPWIAPSLRLKEYRSLARDGASSASNGRWAAFSQAPYLCTLCGRCGEVCPLGIRLPALWRAAREDVASRSLSPARLEVARQAVVSERNVVNYPNIERALWVDYAADAPADGWRRKQADVLYFVGCMTSFSPAAQGIAVAFAEVMERAGVDFALLGSDEWCCGFPLLVAGMRGQDTETLQRHNIEQLQGLGARTVVFNCPSCFDAWQKYYRPQLPAGVELYHSTQFLAKLLAEGKLEPHRAPRIVTYHDPCDLGRNGGVYEEPRAVLRSLPGVELREPKHNRALAHCCGGGGDLEIVDADLAASICANTLAELQATGAETLVVACPECKRMFQNAVRKQGAALEVMDIVELVHEVTVPAVAAERGEG
ncbi:MAG: (Fe-S)-binding protein [Chloroflexota bacterium]|nr:(Fe-S)-binding protein [Chloroflexota bacterium]